MTQIIAMFQQMTQMVAAVVSADDSAPTPVAVSGHTNKAVIPAKPVPVSAPAPAPAPAVVEETAEAEAEVAEEEEVIQEDDFANMEVKLVDRRKYYVSSKTAYAYLVKDPEAGPQGYYNAETNKIDPLDEEVDE
jgi:hypothetical protein